MLSARLKVILLLLCFTSWMITGFASNIQDDGRLSEKETVFYHEGINEEGEERLIDVVVPTAFEILSVAFKLLSKSDFFKITPLLEKALKKAKLSKEYRERLAYHEAGHTLVQALKGLPIRGIGLKKLRHGMSTVLNRTNPVCFASFTKNELLNVIMVMQAGFVAEKIKFGNFAVDVTGDLRKATELAILMVKEWGMSEKHEGIASMIKADTKSSGKHSKTKVLPFKEEDEQEIFEILQKQWNKTYQFIKENEVFLHAIAKKLLEKSHVRKKEIVEILSGLTLAEK